MRQKTAKLLHRVSRALEKNRKLADVSDTRIRRQTKRQWMSCPSNKRHDLRILFEIFIRKGDL